MLEMVVLVAATVGAWRNKSWRDRNRKVWNSVVGWVVACSAMMFSVTALLWRILPKLQFMQFPWRWLLCLSMILSIFVALGLRRWWMRGAICVMTVVVIAVAWHHVQTPWWDNVGDLREMEDNVATGAGYEGTDEYTPVGADPAAIDKDARKVTVEGPARAAMRVLEWNTESKSFSAEMSAPDQLALRLFRYPAWQVEVNGRVVETASRAGTGQMLVPVEAGANRVQITLVRTWDRTVGGWGSLLSALCLVVWSVAVRSSRNHAVV
jgi:hypothetical protein